MSGDSLCHSAIAIAGRQTCMAYDASACRPELQSRPHTPVRDIHAVICSAWDYALQCMSCLYTHEGDSMPVDLSRLSLPADWLAQA